MKFRPLAFLSLRSFQGFLTGRGEGRQLLGSVIGMSLGLIPLIVVLVVADGMIAGITDRYLETSNYHLQVYPMGLTSRVDFRTEVERLQTVPGVARVFQERSGFGLGYSQDRRMGIQLRGLDQTTLTDDPGFQRYLRFVEGSNQFGGPDGVLIGTEVARQLGLHVGDAFKILTARPAPGDSLVPRISTQIVRGIFTSGYQDLDKLWVILPFDQALRIMAGPDYRTSLGLKLTDHYYQLATTSERVQAALPLGFRVYTWEELGQAQFKNFETTRVLLLFTMFMILLVSAVNISSAMMMIVYEKQKDIGILKALGASPGNISRMFTLMGAAAGLVGAALGTSLGLLAAVNVNGLITALDGLLNFFNGLVFQLSGGLGTPEPIKVLNAAYYLEQIPISLDFGTILSFAGLSIVLATVAAWFPARSAARLKPLEVLRKI